MSRARQKGFTLVEVLVALTIASMMSLAIFSALRLSLSAWRRASQRIEVTENFRLAAEAMRRQIACAYPVRVSGLAGIQVMPASILTGATQASPPFFIGTSNSMSFVTISALRFREHPGLTIVNYKLHEEMGKTSLVETERIYLGPDSLKEGTLLQPKESAPTPLFDGVELVEFSYLDKPLDAPPMWVDSWDASQEGELPAAVRVKLVLRASPREPARSYNFTVSIQSRPWGPSTRLFRRGAVRSALEIVRQR